MKSIDSQGSVFPWQLDSSIQGATERESEQCIATNHPFLHMETHIHTHTCAHINNTLLLKCVPLHLKNICTDPGIKTYEHYLMILNN